MKKLILFFLLLTPTWISLCAATSVQALSLAQYMDVYNKMVKEIYAHYVDSVPVEKMITTGIHEMLAELDPYTNFIPEKESKDFKLMTTGEYGGIGSLITMRNKRVIISELYEGKPAHKAGLLPGDTIVKVNGEDMIGKNSSDVSERLRGVPDTEVQLEILREGANKPLKINLIRKNIYLNPVTYYGMVGDSIAYIYLDHFTKDCATEVQRAWQDLKQQFHPKGLILDLRSNPGGLLSEATSLCSLFLPLSTQVVDTKGKGGKTLEIYRTDKNPMEADLPLVVLVNEYSASASEIVAGALQDLDRAVVLGTRTYGKGLVQGTYPLPYKNMIKVTIAKYYIPSGRCIQAVNYTPKEGEAKGEIPDSLTHEFTTRAGRKVRDGRGISPDKEIKQDTLHTIIGAMVRDYLTFDYASMYVKAHTAIDTPDKFHLSESDWEDYKQFVAKRELKYELPTEKKANQLIEAAKKESYYEDNKALFDSLANLTGHNLEKDMETNKKAICRYLEQEILRRYYFQAGAIQHSLLTDPCVDSAKVLLQDPKRYQEILQP